MADPRFFKNAGPVSLAELAQLTGAVLRDPAQDCRTVADVAPLDTAGPDQISFIDNVKYRDQFAGTRAGACFAAPAMLDYAPAGTLVLVTDRPYKAYALTAQRFYPDIPGKKTHVAAGAHVDTTATVGPGVHIDAGAVIGPGVKLGAGCHIGPNAVIGENVELGAGCRVGAQASVSHALIGSNVRLYPGVRIGQDGFGFAIDPAGHVKVPQLGRVVIEDNVEIGANSCIDRGAGPDTVIGAGTWIDNLVQIGHNVKIGRGCVIVSQVGISGSSVVEDYAVLAGQVGVAGHLRIGKGARIGAQSGIMRDVPAGTEVVGSPAMPIREKMREFALIARLVRQSRTKDKD